MAMQRDRSARTRGRGAAAVLIAAVSVLAAGCTSSHVQPVTDTTQTHTATETTTPTNGPIAAGPTTTAAGTCRLLPKQTAADDLGMRLAKERVLVSGGKQVGCEFYAIQNSPLATSERLPGPNQPVLRITSARYATALEAHNAMVLLAEAGTQPQQITVAKGNIGLAYQTQFYPPDHGTDWACAFTVGAMLVVVHTVVTSPALNAIEIAKAVASKF
jgi:hypothetical protein